MVGSKSQIREAIGRATAAVCARDFSPDLRAAVLTGSLARDEATIVGEANRFRVLGDAEFLLVFRRELPDREYLSRAQCEIERRLAADGVQCAVDLAAGRLAYLRNMRPHIFGYELRRCGRVVWGDPEILAAVPAFTAEEIPLEDAWRLLANRLIEGIEAVETGTDAELRYRTVKLYLDMATSLLVFAGKYAPSYRERARQLRMLAAEPGRRPFPLEEFADAVEQATLWKLNPADAGPDGNWSCWRAAAAHAHALWHWELERLNGAGARAGARLRGWAYVLRKEGWWRSWRNWARWARIGWNASPRELIYRAAAELVFAAGRPERVALRLPLFVGSAGGGEAASMIALHYRRYLMHTRA